MNKLLLRYFSRLFIKNKTCAKKAPYSKIEGFWKISKRKSPKKHKEKNFKRKKVIIPLFYLFLRLVEPTVAAVFLKFTP